MSSKVCAVCNRPFSLWGKQARSSSDSRVCAACSQESEERLNRFRGHLQAILVDWRGNTTSLNQSIDLISRDTGVPRATGLSHCRSLSEMVTRKALAFALHDGYLSVEEENHLGEIMRVLQHRSLEISAEITHRAFMRDLSDGKLPRVETSLSLPSGEIAHMEDRAEYHRILTSSVRVHAGLLTVTNQRIIFSRTDHPFEIAFSKVVRVAHRGRGGFALDLSRKQGSGNYSSPNAFYFVEVIQAVVDVAQRRKLYQQAGTRTIDHSVRQAVWSRDGGKCVQCGASDYLEFDHVIPFSKGGASTEANVQLLCRRCNLQKGARL